MKLKKNYLVCKRIVELEGPQGLRYIKGFKDESLKDKWKGFRSSRLNQQWRVIYQKDKRQMSVYVIEVNPHKY